MTQALRCRTRAALEKVITMASARATSYRLDPDIKQALAGQAGAEGISERALLERLITEGLRTLHHSGIVYRDGPTGRRAALAGGPDVWEVASALRHTSGTEQQRIDALAEQFDLPQREIGVAIDFAAAHVEEIQGEVAANDEAVAHAQRLAEARAHLMAS